MIECKSTPISCLKCSGKMVVVHYDTVLNVLEDKSWQVCKECNFQRSADDFKESLSMV